MAAVAYATYVAACAAASPDTVAKVVRNLIKLLRSEDDDIFINSENQSIETERLWERSYESDYLCTNHLGSVKLMILNEVIAYCKHLANCSFDKNKDDPNFYPRLFNRLDDHYLFELITECIRYCYSSVVKGRGLCSDINILLNTLARLASLQAVKTNVTTNLMDYVYDDCKPSTIIKVFQKIFTHTSLIDALVCKVHDYYARLEQPKPTHDYYFYEAAAGLSRRLYPHIDVEALFTGWSKTDDLGYKVFFPKAVKINDKLEREGGNQDAENTDDPSCKTFPKGVKINGKLEREGGIQDAKFFHPNKEAYAARTLGVSSGILGSRRVKNKLAMLAWGRKGLEQF